MKKLIIVIMVVLVSISTMAMEYFNPEAIISATELNNIKDNENTVVVDVRWNELATKTIPGAVTLNSSDLTTTKNNVKLMAVSKEEFEDVMSKLGIVNTDTIIITDDNGNNSTRLWWMLKLYGHKGQIRILDGAINEWEKSGLPMEAPKIAKSSNYIAKDKDKSLVATLKEVEESIDNKNITVIDTRSDKERDAGYIPESVHINWTNNLVAGKFKTADELNEVSTDAGISPDLDGIYIHCKSAYRATHTMFVLVELLGYNNVKNYDGSWIEYGEHGAEISK